MFAHSICIYGERRTNTCHLGKHFEYLKEMQTSNKQLKIQNIVLPVCTQGAACRLRWQQPHVGGRVVGVTGAR